jgi:glycosyltransferase involved in cell wall biosynthesis
MLYVINDTAVTVGSGKAKSASQGGTSAYVADFLNFLLSQKKEFGAIGSFFSADGSHRNIYSNHPESNYQFLKYLFRFFSRHSFSEEDLLYFQRPDHAATAYFSRAKIIVHLHGQQGTTIKNRRGFAGRLVYNLLEKAGLKKAVKVIATDPVTANAYQARYPFLRNRMVIIPTGIDTAFFQPASGNDPFPENCDQKSIIYIGRLAYPKRVDQIIRALELARLHQPLLRLIITGDGTELESLRSLATQLGLDQQITFTGLLKKEEIRSLIRQSQTGILLSYHEGSPISVKELLACGKPVICNQVGDVTDYVIPGVSGMLVDADSLREIADAMVHMAENPVDYSAGCIAIAKKYQIQELMKLSYIEINRIENTH